MGPNAPFLCVCMCVCQYLSNNFYKNYLLLVNQLRQSGESHKQDAALLSVTPPIEVCHRLYLILGVTARVGLAFKEDPDMKKWIKEKEKTHLKM